LEHQVRDDFLAVIWDGFGFGSDGTLWGGEFFQRSGDQVSRIGSLRSFPVFGGERMAIDTRLSALSLLSEACPGRELEWLSRLNISMNLGDAALHLQRCHGKSVLLRTSSAGRLIDGVCCLLGISTTNSYEGQAGILLNERSTNTDEVLSLEFEASEIGLEADWRPMIRELIQLRIQEVAVDEIAGRFWNSLAMLICGMARTRNAQTILLGGGCFQGPELLRRTEQGLRNLGARVFWPQRVPAGDGGISLGQLAVSNFMESQSKCV
jgi:hydrogenase maturation protein HypF